ncbi:hypothetical protein [Streptomyces venezuelae]|uniref:hypothetical protein n=1 Tax=Streptomyces venezuelae TaxID=54571 RepID=UPI00278BDD0A|nr:hypothetical protein [Streptomyces venezuelae]
MPGVLTDPAWARAVRDEDPGGNAGAALDDLAVTRPDLVRLAECLCLAAGVERPFLRRARLRFLPRSTAGLEAELWFSPLVEAAGDQMLLLDPVMSAALRRRLARGPAEHVQAVREFTVEAHREAPPLMRWFEELLWAGSFPVDDGHRRVRDALARMLLAVTAGDDDAADDLGRWALHYLPRLPDGVLRHDDAWRIQVASSERLGLAPPPDPFARPDAVADGARALVRREVVIGVTARSGGLVLSRPPAPDAVAVRASGGHTVRLDVAGLLEPAPRSAPVRVELPADRTVMLPLSVVQRLQGPGVPVLSVVHPGRALEVAVASLPAHMLEPGAAHLAFLMRDGTIVLHDREGEPVSTVPAPSDGATRRSVALSARGTTLAWVEDHSVHQCAVVPEPGRVRITACLKELVSVQFPPGVGETPTWAVLSDGLLTHCVVGAPVGRGHLAEDGVRAVWPFLRDHPLAMLDDDGRLWLCGTFSRHQLLAEDVTAVSGSRGGEWLVAARRDGSVLAWRRDRMENGHLVGQAPWEVTGLAVDADASQVAAVGGDGRVLVCDLSWSPAQTRVLRVGFSADRVFADASGGWTVAGSGGPVELRTEDGRRHVVSLDREPDRRAPDVPSWILGCVLAEVDASELWGRPAVPPSEVMRDIAATGVRCVVAGPFVPPPLGDENGAFDGLDEGVAVIEAAHAHGVRCVVDLVVSGDGSGRIDAVARAGLYDGVRRWLDRGADGVRISGQGAVGRRLLRDLHHLLQGYGQGVLLRNQSRWPTPASFDDPRDALSLADACHVVTLLPDTELADAILPPDAPDPSRSGAFEERLIRAQRALTAARPGTQWAHPLPERLRDPAHRALAAAILLSLPGCPTLPVELLREPGTAALLRIRRAHLALSKGGLEPRPFDRPEVLGFLRGHGPETVLCLANTAEEPVTVSVPVEFLSHERAVRLLDLCDGRAFTCDALTTVTVDGLGVRWLLVAPPAPAALGTRG